MSEQSTERQIHQTKSIAEQIDLNEIFKTVGARKILLLREVGNQGLLAIGQVDPIVYLHGIYSKSITHSLINFYTNGVVIVASGESHLEEIRNLKNQIQQNLVPVPKNEKTVLPKAYLHPDFKGKRNKYSYDLL